AKQSRVSEVSSDDITERDMATSASRLPAGLQSAEAEVLDALPDGDIRDAMSSLPGGFAEVLFYADVEGYTYAETAVILDIPIGTV
ncbi:RNA polymerase subunit sigma-70, partial [Mycobacterium sp. ITM-2017-0098]